MLLTELSLVRAAHIVLACSSTQRAGVLSEQLSTRVRCVAPSPVATGQADVVDVAKQNALEVFERAVAPFQAHHGRQPSLVVGVDTVVSVGDHTFGKPASTGQARDMLTELAAAGTHKVTTGVALVYGDPAGTGLAPAHVQTFVEETTVELDAQAMSAEAIEAYVSSGEPMDSPGAYRVRGLGAAFVRSVVGEPLNAEHGLPLHRFLAEIDPTRLKAWIEAVPEEESPSPAVAGRDDDDDAPLDDDAMPPGIVCEDDACGLPSD